MRTETSTYRLCRAGQDLLRAFDTTFPRRDHLSDGWVGDASHAARRSDHNVNWSFRPGIVKALDIDKDVRTANSFADFNNAVERVRLIAASGDRRFRGGYIIWNRRIASAAVGWRWARYYGENGHTIHAHFSFADLQSNFDFRAGYNLRAGGVVSQGTVAPTPINRHVHQQPIFREGSVDPVYVRDLQGHLNYWRKIRGLSQLLPDGKFGPATNYCVRIFQQAYGLTVDGVVGPTTWQLLHSTTNYLRLESDGRGF